MINLKKHHDDFLFLPLGGAKEIGMNLNLYHFAGKWLVIDMGIGFAGDAYPGIDIIVPDISFLEKIKKDIIAIIITHAHEDHLGAVQYLWDKLEKPIYTSKFTSLFLQTKLKEYGLHDKVPIHHIDIEKPLLLKPFTLEFVPINHSIPEMNAVLVSTDKGTVFHTGDWKFDHNPVIGQADNMDKLKAIGDAGVLAFVCDSTNIFNKGHSGSEGDLKESLKSLIKKESNMVVVTMFASNLGRILALVESAKESGRKIVVCGRSLERMVKIGRELKYIKDGDIFISRNQIKKYPRNKLLLISTGCQGEPNATVNKLALGEYPQVKLQPNDTVIFSSKIIPGNELKIGRILNLLASKKIKTITEKEEFVHVSGHPGQEELQLMYDLVRPNTVIPVHGETRHLQEHVRFVEKNTNAKQVLKITNGDCISLDSESSQVVAQVPSGYLGVDGNGLVNLDGQIVKQRRIASANGVVILKIELDKKGRVSTPLDLRILGLLDERDDKEFIYFLHEEFLKRFQEIFKNQKKIDRKEVEKKSHSILKSLFKQNMGKFPLIEIL